MCLGADRMRLGASEARIGVSCTGRALQRACSIFLQGLTGRGAFCWPPFAALLVSVANLLLALTGMLEGVREWGRALSVCSLFSVLCSRLSASHCRRFAPATPPRQVRPGQESQICTGTTPPACLDWQLAVVIVWGLLTHDSHQPGRSLQWHQAHLTR
jgi:hypothetical protein